MGPPLTSNSFTWRGESESEWQQNGDELSRTTALIDDARNPLVARAVARQLEKGAVVMALALESVVDVGQLTRAYRGWWSSSSVRRAVATLLSARIIHFLHQSTRASARTEGQRQQAHRHARALNA